MKKRTSLFVLGLAVLLACNDADNGKDDDSVDKADEVNEQRQDTASNNNAVVVDENSSTFLVRAANAAMTEMEMVRMTGQTATMQPVKDFAAMLGTEHRNLQSEIKSLAESKKIVLPAAVSNDDQKDINDLAEKTGNNFDKTFMNEMIDRHKECIRLYEGASKDAGDADIKTFANNTLAKLRLHLDSAQALKKRLW